MKPANSTDFWIAAAFLALGVVALTVWIPLDIDSGIIEKVRRREKMGDALFPTAIAGAMVIVALVSMLLALLNRPDETPTLPGLKFLAAFCGICLISLLLMRYVGPAAVSLFGAEGAEYRNLRDEIPWKYLGFASGGLFLVAGLTALVRGRPSLNAILIGSAAVLAMILLYDVPFDDLLLPPNGDV